MNPDEKWQKLLSTSMPTFAGEATPPYGFVTATLGRLRSEQGQQVEAERIGWRALLASLVAVVVAATIAFTVNATSRPTEFDPGVRSMVQMDNLPLS